jgi:hypothetical protein
MLEFTVGMMTFFVILFGIIEFSYIFYQWNAATKAVQFGARLAAVSDPVASDLTVDDFGLGGGVDPGDPMPYFVRTCTATSANGSSGTCSGGGTYDPAAMRAIVFGRDADGSSRTVCAALSGNPLRNGMCNYFPDINSAQRVQIKYEYTGLGYAGRPGGPVPTITVSLTGISYSFVFLNSLMGFGSAQVPALSTTVTGEDLRQTAGF